MSSKGRQPTANAVPMAPYPVMPGGMMPANMAYPGGKMPMIDPTRPPMVPMPGQENMYAQMPMMIPGQHDESGYAAYYPMPYYTGAAPHQMYPVYYAQQQPANTWIPPPQEQPAPQQKQPRSHNSSGSSSPLFQALNANEYDDDNNWPAPAFTSVDAASPHTLSPTLSSNGPNLSQELSVLGMLGLTPDKAANNGQFQPIPDIALPESKINDEQASRKPKSKKPEDPPRWPEDAPPMPNPEEMAAWSAGRGMVPMVPAALLPFLYNPMYAQLLAHWQAGGLQFPYDERVMRAAGRGHQFDSQRSKSKSRETGAAPAQPRARSQNTYSFADGVLVVTEKDGTRTEHRDLLTLSGRLGALCRDQHGCRFVQRQLDDDTAANFPLIFGELVLELGDLMSDPFGNYMVQKLIEVATGESRRIILSKICMDAVSTACNMHGTRTIQKAVECLSDPAEIQMFMDAVRDNVATMVKDVNGNHVIQKCLSAFSNEQKQFIFDVIADQCCDIATHRHGCCVMQRCFDHGSDAQRTLLVDRVVENTLILVQDPFGNYVVQYILDLHRSNDITRIAESILGHIGDLSTQKFSSNVIEKILQVCDPPPRSLIIREMLKTDQWFTLLQDPYANYVIQTAIQTANPVDRNDLIDAIKPHLPSLRNTPYGKRIQSKISSMQQSGQWTHTNGNGAGRN